VPRVWAVSEPPSAPVGRRKEVFRFLWPALLVAAVVINLIEFPIIEAYAGPWYGALPEYSSPVAADIVSEHMEGVESTYGFEFRLAALTDYPRLTTFNSSRIQNRSRIRMAVSEVEVRQYSPDVSAELGARLRAHFVAQGTDASLGDYGIALSDEGLQVSDLVAVRHEGRLILADRSLLPDGFFEEAR
jgi:hypothetical protein